MLSCRQARLEDAETLFAMVRELAAHEDSLAALHTDLQRFRQDGFGPQARFAAVLAEVDGQPAGYISYTHAYAIWRGAASLNVDDIYVRAAFRRQGVGEALLLVGFEYGTRVHRQAEGRAVLGFLVLHDVVAHAVGKFADLDMGIERQIAA